MPLDCVTNSYRGREGLGFGCDLFVPAGLVAQGCYAEGTAGDVRHAIAVSALNVGSGRSFPCCDRLNCMRQEVPAQYNAAHHPPA